MTYAEALYIFYHHTLSIHKTMIPTRITIVLFDIINKELNAKELKVLALTFGLTSKNKKMASIKRIAKEVNITIEEAYEMRINILDRLDVLLSGLYFEQKRLTKKQEKAWDSEIVPIVESARQTGE
jgi:hypothetical protein